MKKSLQLNLIILIIHYAERLKALGWKDWQSGPSSIKWKEAISEKTTAIRRTALREPVDSLQSCVPNWAHPLRPVGPLKNWRVFKGALNWAPMTPRDDSFSDDKCNSFQSPRQQVIKLLMIKTDLGMGRNGSRILRVCISLFVAVRIFAVR